MSFQSKESLLQDSPEKLIPPHGGYRKLKSFQVAQQNWGAILHEGMLRLSPTYDHGASLARNLTDENRKSRLETRDKNRTVQHFAGKARSGFYATPRDNKTLFALDVFRRFAERDIAAARIWLGKLSEISQNAVDAILAEIPPQRMSPVTRAFTLELLTINQRRLLESLSP